MDDFWRNVKAPKYKQELYLNEFNELLKEFEFKYNNLDYKPVKQHYFICKCNCFVIPQKISEHIKQSAHLDFQYL